MTSSPSGKKSPNWLTRLVSHSPRSGSDEAGDTDGKARRREQVRRAQRTHRDRKATYVKALEFEVAKLRARDISYDEELKKYKETIRRLRDLLVSNQIPIPTGLSHIEIHSPMATIEISGGTVEEPGIHAHMPVFDAAAPFPFEKDLSNQKSLPQLPTPSNSDHHVYPPAFDPMTIDLPTRVNHPYGLDTSQVGVDFVLALEQPCLWHAQNPSPMMDGVSGTGHHLMLINPIMSRSPQQKTTINANGLPATEGVLAAGTKWGVPAVELDKLLSFSQGLELDGEVTPVQAWQRIRAHPKFFTLTPTALETLRQALLMVVQCYGFGAVIDESYFREMMTQTFGEV